MTMLTAYPDGRYQATFPGGHTVVIIRSAGKWRYTNGIEASGLAGATFVRLGDLAPLGGVR